MSPRQTSAQVTMPQAMRNNAGLLPLFAYVEGAGTDPPGRMLPFSCGWSSYLIFHVSMQIIIWVRFTRLLRCDKAHLRAQTLSWQSAPPRGVAYYKIYAWYTECIMNVFQEINVALTWTWFIFICIWFVLIWTWGILIWTSGILIWTSGILSWT